MLNLGTPTLNSDPSLDPSNMAPPSALPQIPVPGQEKKKGKGAETALNLLGTLAGLAGKLFFGPEFDGDLGAPFKAGAGLLRQKRDEQGMIDLLKGNPHTAPLVDAGSAVHEAGGAVNNLHLLDHPDVNEAFQIGGGGQQEAPAPNLQGPDPMQLQAPATPPTGLNIQQAVMPEANPLSEPTPPATAPQHDPAQLVNTALSQGANQNQMDFTSDDFIRRAAELRPDLVPALMQARISKTMDPTQEIMQRLGIANKLQQMENYETPAQKREAEKQNRLEIVDAMGKMQAGNQRAAKEQSTSLAKSKISQKEEDVLKAMDEVDQINQEIGANLTPDFVPSQNLGLLDKYGGTMGHLITQKFSPRQALIEKQTKKRAAAQVKAASGASATDKEREFHTLTLPQLTDNPKLFPLIYRNDVRQSKENRLRYLQQIKGRGGDISGYIDPKIIDVYSELRKELYNDPQKVQQQYNNPEIKRALNYLKSNGYDLQYEFAPAKK